MIRDITAKTILFGLALLIVSQARAETSLYAEGGLAYTDKWTGRYVEHEGLHATAEVGITHNNISLYALHISDPTTNKDRGMNMIGVKVRFEFRLD